MQDQELMLIESLLKVIDSAKQNSDLGPAEIARAVEYVCDRIVDDYEREKAEEEREEREEIDLGAFINQINTQVAAMRARLMQSCDCDECRAARGQPRFDA